MIGPSQPFARFGLILPVRCALLAAAAAIVSYPLWVEGFASRPAAAQVHRSENPSLRRCLVGQGVDPDSCDIESMAAPLVGRKGRVLADAGAAAAGAFALVFLAASLAASVWRDPSRRRAPQILLALALAAGVSVFWTAVFFPAMMTNDSLDQWIQGLTDRYTNLHPPVMALLMHLAQYVTRSPAFFAFIQGGLFWAAIYLALRSAIPSPRLWVVSCAILTCNPALWPYTSILWKDVWTASFSVLAIPALIRTVRTGSARAFLQAVACIAAAGLFRYNALTMAVVPAIVGWRHVWNSRAIWVRAACCAAVMAAVVAPARLINLLPSLRGQSMRVVIISEYVGVISRLPAHSAEYSRERDRFDRLFGSGKLDECVAGYATHLPCGDYIFSGANPILPAETLGPYQEYIFREVIRVSARHPILALRHRTKNVAHLVQFQPYEVFYPYCCGIDGWGRDLNLVPASLLPGVRARVLTILYSLRNSLWFRHYLYLAVLAVGPLLFRKRAPIYVCSLVGLSYFLGFLMIDVQPEWRYLLPTYLCGWIGLLSLLLGAPEKQAAAVEGRAEGSLSRELPARA